MPEFKLGPVAQIKAGKGQHYDLCILSFNLDIESGTCSSTLDKDGVADKGRGCVYCYSSFYFKNNPDAYRPKQIKESEFKKIADKYSSTANGQGLILRIGKQTDCGSMHTREQLYQVLEHCVTYKFRPIVTSKLLNYDKRVADLVKAANGIVHISLGDDKLEPGAVAQGATNRWRLAQALKYQRAGCPTQVRIVADVTMAMSAFHRKAFELGGGSKFVLLTPLHYSSKSCFELNRKDITWDQAKSTGLFTYVAGDLRPTSFHTDYAHMKERCGWAGREYCNNCVRKISFDKKSYKKQLTELGWK